MMQLPGPILTFWMWLANAQAASCRMLICSIVQPPLPIPGLAQAVMHIRHEHFGLLLVPVSA